MTDLAQTAPQGENDQLTRMLEVAASGGVEAGAATNELLPLVYQQLRRIAQQRLSSERSGHTLDATSLVHEAYMRLVGNSPLNWASRAQFFFAAAESMRRILIEHARARATLRRGGDGRSPPRKVPISLLDLAEEDDSQQILALDEAIARLEQEDPQTAQVVRLRFFAGLSVDQTAQALGISPRTVDREWAFARAKLHLALKTQHQERPTSGPQDGSTQPREDLSGPAAQPTREGAVRQPPGEARP
jgi:RNA polymerase sigma factor (TIGR02999 family)